MFIFSENMSQENFSFKVTQNVFTFKDKMLPPSFYIFCILSFPKIFKNRKKEDPTHLESRSESKEKVFISRNADGFMVD